MIKNEFIHMRQFRTKDGIVTMKSLNNGLVSVFESEKVYKLSKLFNIKSTVKKS